MLHLVSFMRAKMRHSAAVREFEEHLLGVATQTEGTSPRKLTVDGNKSLGDAIRLRLFFRSD